MPRRHRKAGAGVGRVALEGLPGPTVGPHVYVVALEASDGRVRAPELVLSEIEGSGRRWRDMMRCKKQSSVTGERAGHVTGDEDRKQISE